MSTFRRSLPVESDFIGLFSSISRTDVVKLKAAAIDFCIIIKTETQVVGVDNC